MTTLFMRALSATLITVVAVAAHAESFASSASSAGSKSVGSLSDSLTGSSNSSSGEKNVAEGNYRVEQVAEVAGKPDHLRLHLQATATTGAAGAVQLDLPRQTVERQGLGAQAVIALRQRPYGMEVAHASASAAQNNAQAAAAPVAFFLLLADAWRNDLQTRAVTL